MDKKLKQRLLGAAVVTVLAVAIVPEVVKNLNSQQVMTTKEIADRHIEAVHMDEQKMALTLATAEQAADREQLLVEAIPPDTDIDALSAEPQALGEPVMDSDAPVSAGSAVTKVTDEPVVKQPQPKPEKVTKAVSKPRVTTTSGDVTPPQQAIAAAVDLPAIQLIAKPSAVTDSAADAWVVQVGSFALEANASLLRDRLRAKKFTAGIESITVNGETMYRVRVGPQTSRAASETVRERLQREENLVGDIVPL